MYIKNMSSEEKMDEINYTYFNALEKLGTNVDELLLSLSNHNIA